MDDSSVNTVGFNHAILKHFVKYDSTPWLIWDFREDQVVGFNHALSHYFLHEVELGQSIKELFLPDSVVRLKKLHVEELLAKKGVVELSDAKHFHTLEFSAVVVDNYMILRANFAQFAKIEKDRMHSCVTYEVEKYKKIREIISASDHHIIWEFDDLGQILEVSEAGLEQLLGYDRDYVIGRNIVEFIDPSCEVEFIRVWGNLKSTKQNRALFQVEHKTKDKQKLPAEAFLYRFLKEDQTVCWVMVDTCISLTLQKRLENVTRKIVSGIAHDIKQPSNVIINSVALVKANMEMIKDLRMSLVEGSGDPREDKFPVIYANLQKILVVIEHETEIFTGLVEDFLIYENLNLKEDYIETLPQVEFKFYEEIQSLVNEYKSKSDFIQYQVDFDGEDFVCLGQKEFLMQRILGVLLRSAYYYVLEFSVEPKIKVQVRILGIHQSKIELEIIVWDNGRTINPKSGSVDLHNLPDGSVPTFVRLRRMGFGLQLVEKIASKLEGCFEVFEEADVGTEQRVRLKLPIIGDVALVEKSRKLRVLFADDMRSQRELAEMLLRFEGVDYEIVSDGDEVLHKIIFEKKVFDVVVLDYQMVRMDGPEVVRVLRESGYSGYIVGVTGVSSFPDIEKFMDAGVNEVRSKPIDFSELLKIWRGGNHEAVK